MHPCSENPNYAYVWQFIVAPVACVNNRQRLLRRRTPVYHTPYLVTVKPIILAALNSGTWVYQNILATLILALLLAAIINDISDRLFSRRRQGREIR